MFGNDLFTFKCGWQYDNHSTEHCSRLLGIGIGIGFEPRSQAVQELLVELDCQICGRSSERFRHIYKNCINYEFPLRILNPELSRIELPGPRKFVSSIIFGQNQMRTCDELRTQLERFAR